MNRPVRIVIFIVATILLVSLPIIPASKVPVVPPFPHRLVFVSLLGIILRLILPLVGVLYRWEWYTWAAILVLVVVIVLLGRYLLRR